MHGAAAKARWPKQEKYVCETGTEKITVESWMHWIKWQGRSYRAQAERGKWGWAKFKSDLKGGWRLGRSFHLSRTHFTDVLPSSSLPGQSKTPPPPPSQTLPVSPRRTAIATWANLHVLFLEFHRPSTPFNHRT